MKIYLGTIIQQRRKELGLSQEKFAEMLYTTQATISKIESNKLIPKINLLNSIAEKLGLPKNRYYVLVDKLEMGLIQLQDKFKENMRQRNFDMAYQDFLELKKCMGEEREPVQEQFWIWSEVVCGLYQKGELASLSLLEKQRRLESAIKKTLPNFCLEQFQKENNPAEIQQCHKNSRSILLSVQEIHILNSIAYIHSKMGDRSSAISLYRALIQYMMTAPVYLFEFLNEITLVISNCGLDMGLVGRYQESVEVSELGRKICLEYSCTNKLHIILNNLGCSYYYLGEKEKGKRFLLDGIELSRIYGYEQYFQDGIRDLKEMYGIDYMIFPSET